MNANEKEIAQQRAIACRRRGGNITDCAVFAGVGRKTIYRWKLRDDTFDTSLSQAWREYKLQLISKVIERKPEYLLEKKFKKEYGDQRRNLHQFNQYNQYNLNSPGDNSFSEKFEKFLDQKYATKKQVQISE